MRALTLSLVTAFSLTFSCVASAQGGAAPWTVEQIFHPAHNGSHTPEDTSWSPDGSRFTMVDDKGLESLNVASGERSLLVPKQELERAQSRKVGEKDADHRGRYDQPDYFWSPDGSRILLDFDGTLWLDTLASGEVRQIGDSGEGSGDDVKFSPDGRMVSYLRGGNLYVQKPGGNAVALTTTGRTTVLNGGVDWVYLEELESRSNYAWSPDSARLAYLQMDESRVPEYPLVDWIPTLATTDEQRYPQPGTANPSVRLGVVAAGGGATRWIELPVRVGDDYVPRLGWVNAHTVWAEVLRRDHKHREIVFADVDSGRTRTVFAEDDAKFLADGYDVHFDLPGSFLLLSWRDGHMHLYRYDYDVADPLSREAKLAGELEHGDYEVSKVLAVDRAAGRVFYESSEVADGKGDPRQLQVWSVGLDGRDKRAVTKTAGVHQASFAPGHGVYTVRSSAVSELPVLSLCQVGADCRELWRQVPDTAHEANPPVLLTLKAADGVTTIYASLTLPKNMTGRASVPLINNPYGGPGAPSHMNNWSRGHAFDELLAEHGFAVLHMDNRGMAGYGRDFEQAAYHDFGQVQLADQLAGIDQVLAKYPQLDPKRLGWWGWSWGGTFTLNALTHSTRFKVGVAVASVTDFRNYDSIYTERYLGLPAEDKAGYDAASVQLSAANLHGDLLLVHGTGDDNVHIANTVQFVQKLIDAGKPYGLEIYPRKTHSIAGAEARTHLYTSIVRQFETYLKPAGKAAE